MIKDYLGRVEGKLAGYADAKRQGELWKAVLGSRTLREITAGDVDRALAKRRAGELKTPEGWSTAPAPATVNRELAFLRRVFNVAIADGLAEANPIRPKMSAKEDNTRSPHGW